MNYASSLLTGTSRGKGISLLNERVRRSVVVLISILQGLYKAGEAYCVYKCSKCTHEEKG